MPTTAIAPGNALCFLDLLASGGSGPAQQGALRDAIQAAGGSVKDFPALSRERMEGWVTTRAAELDITLARQDEQWRVTPLPILRVEA